MATSYVIGHIPRDTRTRNGKTMHVVKLLFYQYGDMSMEEGDMQQGMGWNWLAACWTGGGCGVTTQRMTEDEILGAAIRGEEVPEPIFTHVELRFSDGYGTSITSVGNAVHYEKRLHTRQNYSFVCEYVMSPGEERRMQSVAHDMYEDGVGFNRRGFILNFLPGIGRIWAGKTSDNSVFCSEYIVKLLHEANRLLHMNPHTTSPQQLYQVMHQEVRDGRAFLSWNREAGIAFRQGMMESQIPSVSVPPSRPSRKSILKPSSHSKTY